MPNSFGNPPINKKQLLSDANNFLLLFSYLALLRKCSPEKCLYSFCDLFCIEVSVSIVFSITEGEKLYWHFLIRIHK